MNNIRYILVVAIIIIMIISEKGPYYYFGEYFRAKPTPAIYLGAFFSIIYFVSYLVKKRWVPYIYNKSINVKLLLPAAIGWFIFAYIENSAINGATASIRLDIIITWPLIVLLSYSGIESLALSIIRVKHE